MHGEGGFSKIIGSICNIRIEVSHICNVLPMPAVSSGSIVVKLKRNLKYWGLSGGETFKFSSIVEFQGETESFTERNISGWKEMSKNINGTRNETEFTAVEDPPHMHRTASNETTLV